MKTNMKLNALKVGTTIVSALAIGLIVKTEKMVDGRLEDRFASKDNTES